MHIRTLFPPSALVAAITVVAVNTAATTREEILDQAVLMADRLAEVKVIDRRWQDAPYLVGSVLVWEELGCAGSPECTQLWDRVDQVTAIGNQTITHGDWAAYAQAALDLYRLTPVDQNEARAARLQVTDEPKRFASLVVEHDSEAGSPLQPWWVAEGYGSRFWQDDLFMVVPWLAMRGSGRSGMPCDEAARNLAYEWIEAYAFDHRKALAAVPDRNVPSLYERRRSRWNRGDPTSGRLLLEPRSGLWWHDPDKVGSEEFWGRGNGWVAASLVRVQHFLDQPYSGTRYAQVLDRRDLRSLLDRMARRLWHERNTYGAWHSDLIGHEGFPAPESSASALLTFMIARGVNEGWLDGSVYGPVALKAMHTLTRLVDADGDLHAIQRAGAGPGDELFASDEPAFNLTYGVGAFLMAAAEVSRFDHSSLRTMEEVEAAVVERDRFTNEGGHLVIAASELGDFATAAAGARSMAAISGQHLLEASYDPDEGGLVRVEAGGDGDVAIFIESGDAMAPGRRYLVPVVAATDGLDGTTWRSDVMLFNPEATPSMVTLSFTPEPSTEQPAAVVVEVPSASSVLLEDLVGQSFHTVGRGALDVRAANELIVSSRTFNHGSEGSFGLHLPAFERSASLVYGDEARLLGLSTGSDHRTNFGCASFAQLDTEVVFTIFDIDGIERGELAVTVPGGDSWLRTRVLQRFFDDAGGAYAVVRVLTPGGSVVPWASVVDGRTGDSNLVTAVKAVQAPARDPLFVAAAAHQPGLAGSFWRTDLAVHNPGPNAAAFNLAFLRSRQSNVNPEEHHFEDLAPGSSLRFDDVVHTLFAARTSGAIRVTPIRGTVMVVSRTYNQGPEGTFGQSIPGVPARDAIRRGDNAVLTHLLHSADHETGFRSNIGFVNVGTVHSVVQLDLLDNTGQHLGEHEIRLAPFEHRQLNEVLRPLSDIDIDGAHAVAKTDSPGAAFLTYASVVDNRTGDAIFLPARRIRPRDTISLTMRHGTPMD